MKRCLFYFSSILFTFLAILSFHPSAKAEMVSSGGTITFGATVNREQFDNHLVFVVSFTSLDPFRTTIQVPVGLFTNTRGYFHIPLDSLPVSPRIVGCASQVKVTQGERINNNSGYLAFTLRQVATDSSNGFDPDLLSFLADVEFRYDGIGAGPQVTFEPGAEQFHACGGLPDGGGGGGWQCDWNNNCERFLPDGGGGEGYTRPDRVLPDGGDGVVDPDPVVPGAPLAEGDGFVNPDNFVNPNDIAIPNSDQKIAEVSGSGCSLGVGLPNSASLLTWVMFSLLGGVGLFRIRQLKKN